MPYTFGADLPLDISVTNGVAQHFGNAHTEYRAARDRAAVFDNTGRTCIEVTGADRARFLHNFCTNDIRGLKPGEGCEAFVTTLQGKVLAHVFVSAQVNSLLLDSTPEIAPRLIKHLSKYRIREEVEFHDRTDHTSQLVVVGPAAVNLFDAAGELQPNQHRTADIEGISQHVRRNDILNLPCLWIGIPRDRRLALLHTLKAKGIAPAGRLAWESLRLEACFPEHGVDFTDDNLAQEAARPQALSFTKGCYLGQEPIARIDALGHVNKEFRVVRLTALPVPPVGSEILSPDDKPVGTVTSATGSLANDLPLAAGLVRRSYNLPGQELRIRVGESSVSGVVQ